MHSLRKSLQARIVPFVIAPLRINMPWFLYIALKQLFPTKRGFSFFAIVSILGVSLGVAVLLGVQTIMNGFGQQIRDSLLKVNGDIRIESNRVIFDWERLEQMVAETPGVETVSPYAHGVVMLQHRNLPVFPAVMAVDMTQEEPFIPIEEFMVDGFFQDLDDDSILIGSTLARRIAARVGSEIELFTPLMLDRLKQDEVLLPRQVRIVGVFQTGRNDVDSNTIVTSLRLMQDLYGLDDGIHGLALRLEDPDQLEEVTQALDAALPSPLRATTWLETNREYVFVLQFEKTMMTIIMFFIILVAAFSIASSLMTSVIRKTREIGLLVAMGAKPMDIAMSYCFQGLVIGISGVGFGMFLQWIIIHNRNAIVWKFAEITNSSSALLRFYQFNDIPARYEYVDFQLVAGMTIVICLLAGILPAMRALNLKPAEALRSE
jgi:lipoprotein-releasing system permease protein